MSVGAGLSGSGVTVGTSATRLVAARFQRDAVIVQNKDAATVFVGPQTVTTSGATAGLEIAANSSITLETFNGELYAISAAGTAANAVRVLEVY